jgi:SPP1 gp7 family putative phage head morphogenesis protein
MIYSVENAVYHALRSADNELSVGIVIMPDKISKATWNQPFKEQIEYFKSKGFVLNPDACNKITQSVHAHSFTVAHVATMDILKDIRKELDNVIKKGLTLKEFKKNLPGIMERKGWTGAKAPWRLDNIFRTNLASSYNTARYSQQLEVAKSRPYWRYNAILDQKTREAHRRMNGRVYRFDDPIWQKWYPPVGFRCRCYVRTLSESQLKKSGLNVQTEPPVMPDGLPAAPDTGFGNGNIQNGLESWKPDLAKYTAQETALINTVQTETDNLLTAAERLVKRDSQTYNRTVELDIDELDAMWAKDAQFYIPRGGGGAEMAGRLEGNVKYFKTGKPIEMPLVHIDKDGVLSFTDGRHRVTVLRDIVQARKITVQIDSAGLKNYQKIKKSVKPVNTVI